MGGHVLLTRPYHDTTAITGEIRQKKGYAVYCEPFLEVVYSSDIDLSSLTPDTPLIFTSKNAVRAFGRLSKGREHEVYVVGDSTAAEAAKAGFTVIHNAKGTVQDLIQILPPDTSLFYARGAQVSHDLSQIAGVRITEQTLYHTEQKREISEEGARLLGQGAFTHILFFSTRTAESFAEYMNKNYQPQERERILKRTKALCLGASMVESLSVLPLKDIQVAAHPTRPNLLDLLD